MMLKSIFSQLLKRTSIVGFAIVLSRITGYVREIIAAAWMGTSSATDAVVIATRIPTLIRKVSTEGSLNGVLIPLINDIDIKRKKNVVAGLITRIIVIFSVILFLLFLIQTYFANTVVQIFSPGTLQNADSLNWFKNFIPYTSLSVIFFFLTGICGAVLNTNQEFFWPAMCSVFWNLILIIGFSTAFCLDLNFNIIGPLFLFSAFVHFFVVLIPYLQLRLPFILRENDETSAALYTFFIRFFPIMFSASVAQINSIILIALTSFLPVGNITILHRAERILQIPIAIIIALNTALLPSLSGTESNQNKSDLIKISLLSTFLIFIPSALIFYFFHYELTELIFHYGKCTASDIVRIAEIVKLYAFGIPAFLLIRILPIFFFAERKTKQAMQGAFVQTFLNFIISVYLMKDYGIVGFTWASIISSWAHVMFLTYKLLRRN